MIFVSLPIKSEVKLATPDESCCNCGASEGIRTLPTDLRRMPLLGLVGAEIKVNLPFPYCGKCAVTAGRKRPNILGILALTMLIAIVMGMAWLFLGPQASEETIEYVVAPLIVLSSLSIVLAYYFLRRPSGEQSSFYQPIRLLGTGHTWPADITGFHLRFTNKQYAQKYAEANDAAVASGKLRISTN